MSVSPVAMSVGLVSSGECWLLAYNVWLGILTYSLFDFPHVEVVPILWETPSLYPHSGVFLVASVLAGVSVSPKPEYLEIMQTLLLFMHLSMHLSPQEVSYLKAVSDLTGVCMMRTSLYCHGSGTVQLWPLPVKCQAFMAR